MVKTHTAEAFDTEEYTADWAKIKISVTRSGSTTTYSIPWTEKTMCNQVSHGC